MTHRDRRRHYVREWSPMWGYRHTRCDCRRDDPDEALWLFVSTLFGLAAALVALVATLIRRPALAAVVAIAGAVALAVVALVWGLP